MNIDSILIVILIIMTLYVTIDLQRNKRKSWANEPLVGLSWVCMVFGTILCVIIYLFD